jgi:tryptophan synthase alpha chain
VSTASPEGAVKVAPGRLEQALRGARDAGRKLLVPYVTGGLDEEWLDVVRGLAAAGADAIEVGIPFSDPVMDGPVIQAASVQALSAGATPAGIIAELARVDADVPVAVMTYVNIVARTGYRRMARELAAAGIAGAIVPDLPLDEAGEWRAEASAAGVDAVLLAAPTTPEERLAAICAASRGFVYAVGLMGVTGERGALAESALTIATRCRALTDTPVLVGVGVSSPEQAALACTAADGVVVGSALVRRLLDGEGPEGAARFVASLRASIDAG